MATIVAIIGVVLLDAWALALGHNGTLLALSVAVIAGLGGYSAKEPLDKVLKRLYPRDGP